MTDTSPERSNGYYGPSGEAERIMQYDANKKAYEAYLCAEALSSASVAALFDKVGGSLEDVQSATTLDWSSKGLTGDDCKLIAHLVASGSLAQLEVSSHPTKAFPAHRALVCALC